MPCRPARRRHWWLAASVLAHAGVLALLLIQPPQDEQTGTEPSYELVFQGGNTPDRSTSEQQGPEQPTPQEPPSETAMLETAPAEPLPLPPTPELSTAEPPPPAPLLPGPSVLQPPSALELAPEAAPSQPEPVPQPSKPAPSPSDPELAPEAPRPPPVVRLAEPDPLPPTPTPQSLVPDLALTVPPIPPPRVPTPTRQVQPRPLPDRRFASPLDLNFGQSPNRAPPPRGSVASRAIDLSPGAPKTGPNRAEAFYDARAAKVGADWANGLAAYWRRHRFYPRQAAENGDDGTVQVELVVNRQGKVESVEISRRSGSPWLDMAALSTWRNAQLAPFPAENMDPRVTLTLTINYILLR